MSKPEEIFRAAGGHLRMSEAIEKGISRYTLYKMRDEGTIEQLSRGVYRLAELPAIEYPDLVTVSLRIPNAVICLVSALVVHGLTTQIHHAVDIALPRTARTPSLDYPVTRVYRFSEKIWSMGIEIQMMDTVPVRVYDAEKTLADCFRYRNQLGMDIVLESFKLYARKDTVHFDKIFEYARAHRSEKALYPYLEVIAK